MKGTQLWFLQIVFHIGILAFLCTVPFMLLFALVLVAIRGVLGAYKRVFRPEYGDFLTGMSNMLSSDWPYDRPVITVGGYMFLQGKLELKDVRAHLTKGLRASPLFPQLQRYLTTWMGFSVWKQDPHFSLENHIKELDDSKTLHQILGNDRFITEENAQDVLQKFTKVPFEPKTCPWDINLCHKVKLKQGSGPVTIVFIRIHHTLGDATAIMKLITILCDSSNDPIEKIQQKFQKSMAKIDRSRSRANRILYIASYSFLALYDLLKHVFDSWDSNAWRNSQSPLRTQFNYVNFSVMKSMIQQARKVHDVSFFSVVMAAQTAALRRHMIKYNVPVPDTIHATVPIPVPRKDGALANDLTFALVTLPVGLNNRIDIVRSINEEQVRLKSSRVPLAMLVWIRLYGLLPRKLLKSIPVVTTCLVSNFPGYEEKPTVLKRRILGIGALTALNSSIGINMWCFGFDDSVCISLGFSPDIMDSRYKVAECARFMEEEVNALNQFHDPFITAEVPT